MSHEYHHFAGAADVTFLGLSLEGIQRSRFLNITADLCLGLRLLLSRKK